MGISVNGPSGIDTASLIEQLVALEQTRVTKVENKAKVYQLQIEGYSSLQSLLSDISAKAKNLNALSSYDMFTPTSSDESIATIKGGIGAVDGRFDLSVYHLAKNEKMISADGKVATRTAALSTYGITTGDISINGTTINITNTDTIQDVRMKINNATDANGIKLGVTASVLKMSDTNFRLVLSAKDSGAQGVEYKDLNGGSTLKDLGIITDVNGAKGNTVQTVKTNSASANGFQDDFDGLVAGDQITLTGTDHDGNKITNTFVKSAGATATADFLAQVKATYHNMVDATIDAGGQLVLTDKLTGSSQLSLTSLNLAPLAGTVINEPITVSQTGKEGAGVLSTGNDAYFNLDGLDMTSAKNNPEGIVTGVTFEFHKASVATAASVSLTRDVPGIQKKVQDLLDSYNSLLKFGVETTHMGDPKKASDKDGVLAGDMTVNSIISQVRSTIKSQLGFNGDVFNSLTMIGVKSDSKSGELSIDEKVFTNAISTHYDEFVRIFVTSTNSENKNIIYGRSTDTTKSGQYTLREPDANHLEIQMQGDSTWYTSDQRMGDVIQFTTGPAQGLSITAASGSLGGVSAGFEFAKGLGDKISNLMTSMTKAGTGSLQIHQDSLRVQIDDANKRVSKIQTSVDAYHDRLVKQFAAMEQILSKMKSQSAKMMSALGVSTTSTSA